MRNSVLKNECNHTDCKDDSNYNYCCGIELEGVVHTSLHLKSLKLIDPTSGNRSRGTRVSSRTISDSDHSRLFDVKAAHLAFVDTSTVIPTWSGSGESLNLSLLSSALLGNDAHRKSSLNLFDFMPANFMAREWVDDNQSLVVEDDSRVKEDLIGDCAREYAPDCCNQATRSAVVEEVNVGKGAEEKETKVGTYVRARGSKELAIGHREIFSRSREMRAA